MAENEPVTELERLKKQIDRLEQCNTDFAVQLDLAIHRTFPAALASLENRISGVANFQADLAGTGAKLALELSNHVDRLTLLEQMAEQE